MTATEEHHGDFSVVILDINHTESMATSSEDAGVPALLQGPGAVSQRLVEDECGGSTYCGDYFESLDLYSRRRTGVFG